MPSDLRFRIFKPDRQLLTYQTSAGKTLDCQGVRSYDRKGYVDGFCNFKQYAQDLLTHEKIYTQRARQVAREAKDNPPLAVAKKLLDLAKAMHCGRFVTDGPSTYRIATPAHYCNLSCHCKRCESLKNYQKGQARKKHAGSAAHIYADLLVDFPPCQSRHETIHLVKSLQLFSSDRLKRILHKANADEVSRIATHQVSIIHDPRSLEATGDFYWTKAIHLSPYRPDRSRSTTKRSETKRSEPLVGPDEQPVLTPHFHFSVIATGYFSPHELIDRLARAASANIPKYIAKSSGDPYLAAAYPPTVTVGGPVLLSEQKKRIKRESTNLKSSRQERRDLPGEMSIGNAHMFLTYNLDRFGGDENEMYENHKIDIASVRDSIWQEAGISQPSSSSRHGIGKSAQRVEFSPARKGHQVFLSFPPSPTNIKSHSHDQAVAFISPPGSRLKMAVHDPPKLDFTEDETIDDFGMWRFFYANDITERIWQVFERETTSTDRQYDVTKAEYGLLTDAWKTQLAYPVTALMLQDYKDPAAIHETHVNSYRPNESEHARFAMADKEAAENLLTLT